MEFVILMMIVIVIFMIVSRFLGGESRKPSGRRSPTGKTRKDSWPAPRRAAAAGSTTTRGTPSRTPQRPSDSERQARDPEIWETLSYSKSGEATRGPRGRDSVVPEFRFGGLQDDAKKRGELREQLHEQYRDDDVDLGASPDFTASPDLEPEGNLVPDPGTAPEFGTTGTAGFDLGTTPDAAGSSSSGYNYSSIGSVYTSTSVYTSSSALGPDSAEPAQDVDGSEAIDEAGGEIGDAPDGNQPAGP